MVFTTNYANMKKHFDRLILGGYPNNNGLEPLRTTYERMFNMSINKLDIYESKLFVPNNTIKSIITLIGPKSEDKIVPTGLISVNDSDICHVSHFCNDELRNFEDDGKYYINAVYKIMVNIIKFDRSKKYGSAIIRNNPYLVLLDLYPFYFTFHHIREVLPELIDSNEFKNILEDFYHYMKIEDASKIIESIKTSKYSESPEDIYSTLTCKNTISFV